jgi:hypothetical protein
VRLAALLLGILCLFASASQQNQLSASILWAATHAEFGASPDSQLQSAEAAAAALLEGTGIAPGPLCTPLGTPSHSHRGHADCTLCGAVGAAAFYDLLAAAAVSRPLAVLCERLWPKSASRSLGWAYSLYRSRAPPSRTA